MKFFTTLFVAAAAIVGKTVELPQSGRITSGVPAMSANEKRWEKAVVNASRKTEVRNSTKKIVTNKARYEKVSSQTGVPWYVIAALHYREASLSFTKHLHEGSPLTGRTKWVPKGRPKTGKPPFTWEYSAKDALEYDKFNLVKKWDIATMLDMMERYNGLGYRKKGIASPYLFGGTTAQERGKYVADGKFDKTVMDKQLGTVAIVKDLEAMGQIKFDPKKRISL